MKRFAAISAPPAAALILRLVQLLILACIARLSSGDEQAALIAATGIISAFAIITDSGAVNYLLSRTPDRLTRGELAGCVSIHAGIGCIGGVIAVGYCWILFEGDLDGWLVLVIALSATQLIDSCVRVVRAPLLVHGDDLRYAIADFSLAALKIAIVGVAFLTGSLGLLLSLPFSSLGVLALFASLSGAIVPRGEGAPGLLKRVLGFGAAGASSALYSQAPLLVGAMLLPLEIVASLSVAYRITQPMEMLPATLSQQILPRMVAGRVRTITAWYSLAGLGVLVAIAVWFALPLFELALGVATTPVLLFLLVILSVPVKYGNYALSAGLYAHALLSNKLLVNLLVGALAIGTAAWISWNAPPASIGAVSLISEVLLSAGMGIALSTRNRRKPR